MSATFVAQLRAGRGTIELAKPGPDTLTIRVEASDIWETVRVAARANAVVADVKQAVVRTLFPGDSCEEDFVLKLGGWEVLNMRGTLEEAGIVDGSILLLAYRRRRPVR